MKRLAIAFTGPSNSGKTTLMVKISNILQKSSFKVAMIKHDPKDKAVFDTPGKDSFQFSQTGADVAVVSATKTTYFQHTPSSLEQMVRVFGDFDYLLVEGLKTLPLPRICLFRERIDARYFHASDTLAVDESIDVSKLPKDMERLDSNNPQQIIQWIDQNAKRV